MAIGISSPSGRGDTASDNPVSLDENEALRNDEKFAYVAAWGYNHDISNSNLNKEILEFNNVKLTTRSYK